MRVQLAGQALRLRVDEAELDKLLAGEVVDNATRWPDGETGHQQVSLAAQAAWQRQAAGWQVTLPQDEVQALAARLPSREGLSWNLPVPDADPLTLRFDVDVRDSARKRYPKHKTTR